MTGGYWLREGVVGAGGGHRREKVGDQRGRGAPWLCPGQRRKKASPWASARACVVSACNTSDAARLSEGGGIGRGGLPPWRLPA